MEHCNKDCEHNIQKAYKDGANWALEEICEWLDACAKDYVYKYKEEIGVNTTKLLKDLRNTWNLQCANPLLNIKTQQTKAQELGIDLKDHYNMEDC